MPPIHSTIQRSASAPIRALEGLFSGNGQHSTHPFREMLDALPAAIYTTDARGRITYFNPACVEFSGRTPTLGSDHWCVTWKLFYPDGRPMPHDDCPMARALKEGRAVRGAEAIAERPDGTRIWFEPYPTPLSDDAGNLIGGINMLVDITERKRAEEARRTREEHFRQTLSLMPAAVYSCDASGRIAYYNERAAQLWGRAPRPGDTDKRFCGSDQLLLPDGTPLPHEQCPMAIALREGRSFRDAEVGIRRLDGSVVHVMVNIDPIRNKQGEVIGAINAFHDVSAIKRAEETISRLAAIVESSEDAIIGKNLDGIITSWNRGAERIFGYSADEVIGQPVTVLVPADRLTEEPGILERLRRGERIEHYETVRRRKGGTLLDISLTVSPIKDGQGRIIGASKIARDITQRKLAEEVLQASHETFRQLVENSPFGVYVVDADFRLSMVSAGAQKVFKSVWPLIGRDFAEVLRVVWPEPAASEFIAFFRQTLATGQPRHSPGTVEQRADIGETEAYDWKIERISTPDGRYGVVCHFYDLSEHQRLETALRESQERLSCELASLERLHELSVRIAQTDDVEEIMSEVMTAGAELLGAVRSTAQLVVDREHALRLVAFAGFEQEYADRFRTVASDGFTTCAAALGSGERVIVEDLASNADYADFAALVVPLGMRAVMSTPLLASDGALMGVFSTYWDRPHSPSEHQLRMLDLYAQPAARQLERRLAERALRESEARFRAMAAAELEARQQAEEANRAKDRFLAVLSHELRTPLTPVLMAAGALEQRDDLPADVREDLGMIHRNVELQGRLIDDLLDLSRITSGKLHLNFESHSINDLARRACDTCRSNLRERGIQLYCDLDAEAFDVVGDAARLQQVFWNLLNNAAKFTPEGGQVFLRTENVAGHGAGGEQVRVTVRDTGIGIAPEDLARIFDAFEQAEQAAQGEVTLARRFGGMGLGLAICRALVEQHRGSIRAHSEGKDRGATFVVELPAAPHCVTAETEAPTGSAKQEQVRALHLLLVEDHPDSAKMLGKLLSLSGHTVKTATTASAALELASEHDFDLVISDLGLPDMTGHELMRQLKQRRPIKGIALSGYGMEEDVNKSHQAGFIDHLVKPVNLAQLQQSIHRVAFNTTARTSGPARDMTMA